MLGTPDVIAYYDTDSIFARFDTVYKALDDRVQELFDIYLELEKIGKDHCLEQRQVIINEIATLISTCECMTKLDKMYVQDITRLDEDISEKFLDENILGACKIEKYVIRGVALGAK